MSTEHGLVSIACECTVYGEWIRAAVRLPFREMCLNWLVSVLSGQKEGLLSRCVVHNVQAPAANGKDCCCT
eukprot:3668365-Amphidinium_carterae.3